MRTEHHYWYSPRLEHDMGVAVFGHWGPPLLVFPTSHGDEWELQRHGLVDAIGDLVDAGKVKVFCVGSNNHESFLNTGAHPLHRSWRQRLFDEYIRNEVIPFIHSSCQSPGIPIATLGASLGAYHAANTLFHYPHLVKRCYALSGIFDLRDFMDGAYDDNFYFQNPVDYLSNLSDPWYLEQLASCEIRIVTGSGPWEKSHYSYALSRVLARRGIAHHLDDWGARGGHDWPYWKEQTAPQPRPPVSPPQQGDSCGDRQTCLSPSSSRNKTATSQLALPKASCDLVYATPGYSASVTNLSQVSLATDNVFSDGSSLELATITGSVSGGLTAALTVAV